MPGTRTARVSAGFRLAVLAGLTLAGVTAAAAAPAVLPDRCAHESRFSAKCNLIQLAGEHWRRGMADMLSSIPERNPLRGPNLRLSAALGPGAKPLGEGLAWRIEKRAPDGKGRGELVWTGGGAEPELILRPGQYYAEVTYGLARNGLEFELPAKQTVTPVVFLNAATLHIRAVAKPGGTPLDGVDFVLRKDGPDGSDSKDFASSSQANAVFHVPAGRYRLVARQGLAAVEMPVALEAGEEERLEVVLNTGEITLSAHAQKDGPSLSGATFFVFENGEAGQHREILRSKREEPKFQLPAGQYRVSAVIGLARVEQDVRIEPGNHQRHHLVLNAGGVRLTSKLLGAGEMQADKLLYRVFDLSSGNGTANREIFTSNLDQPTIFLPKGRYRIESQYGFHNARQAREVDVAAGEVSNVDFELKACDVKLRLVSRSGGMAMDRVKWTLKYNGGGTVLISQDAEPSLILQAGSYQAIAQHDGKPYTSSFDAASGKGQVIEVEME
jgi:hypothetical protein